MKNSQIERWALEIIDRVEAHQPIEDSRVELKARWPEDSAKAARRIAGHANAARGEHILWLIGVEEENGVSGADYQEMADWFARVSTQFDGLAPRCCDLNVPTKDRKTVVALLFETDRAPFVVLNPAFGNTKGEGVRFEVPWREGTSVRTASRMDILKVLSDTKPLLALLGELEFNAVAASRLAQFRENEFTSAIATNAFLILSQELKEKIFNAYIEMSSANMALVRSNQRNDNSRPHRPAFTVEMYVAAHMEEASSEIHIALESLRQYLGVSQSS